MKGKKFLASLLLCSVLATGVGMSTLTACRNNSNPPEEQEEDNSVTSISLNYSSYKIRLGNTWSGLSVTVVPSSASVTWASSDPTIATVTDRGNVLGIKEGTAVITATAGSKVASCTVEVIDGAILEVKDETEEVISKVTGNTYYVAPDGNKNATGTESDPYDIRTLIDFDHTNDESGLDWGEPILKAGDTVIVKNGDYILDSRIQLGYSGDYNNPITIKKEAAEGKATLKFYDMIFADQSRGVQINGNYFIWDGIDICGAGDNGMYIGGSYNVIQNCEFYDNRDTGLQLGRAYGSLGNINDWPSYNLIKNCTSYNNYDNETYGENADGFAAKLTVGYGNIFDGCIAYRNSDDGWDLYAKVDTGNIGAVIIYNCVAFDNGFIMEPQSSFNAKFPNFDKNKEETNTDKYDTRDGDGNGFKLGGSVMEGEVFLYNCLAFNNRMHGVTDNSNPGVLVVDTVTSYNNAANVDNRRQIALDSDDNELKDYVIVANKVYSVDADGNPVSEIADATIVDNPTYGHIIYTPTAADECANIDVARQTYSYNHISNILSVNNGNPCLVNDNYRGTVTNSILQAGSNSYQIDESEEYDTKQNINGTKVTPIAASVWFKQLPTNDYAISYGEGYSSPYHYLDATLRNADGSINMGDMLALVDATGTRGAKLSLSSWADYKHFNYSDMTQYQSRQAATAQAIYDMLYLPTDLDGCYQDFQVVSTMMHYPIFWTSSDSDVLSVSKKVYDSFSGSFVNKVEVLRPVNEDKTVTLTAQINVGNVVIKEKTFTVTVKKNTFKIGDVIVEGLVDDEIIVDQYGGYTITAPTVLNGASESGKVIDPSLYDISYKYELAIDSDHPFEDRIRFDSNQEGIWRVTATITLKPEATLNHAGTQSAAYTYLVYVASPNTGVDFLTGTEGVFVNKDGYTIYGQPTNPTGVMYVLKTASGATVPTAAEVEAQGEVYEFRTTYISKDFIADNSNGYDIHYIIKNTKGDQCSAVHTIAVTTVDITTKADFEAMLAENSAQQIYRLMNDIDFGGSLTTSDTKFVGLFNGMGHTLKNIAISNNAELDGGFGIFRTVDNGTIMNVKFEDITITELTSKHQKTGIIGLMYGGSIYNVKIKNVKVTGNQRVSALIGQVIAYSNKGATTTIERVEVINDVEYKEVLVQESTFSPNKYYIKDGDNYVIQPSYTAGVTYYERVPQIVGDRSGGIVGFIQGGNGNAWNIVTISDCYVDVTLKSGDYCAGIVGRSDDREINGKDSLTINNCYFSGVIYGTKRAAGILGGFTGAGVTRINGCISIGKVYYGSNLDIVTTSQKNSSGIVGNFSATADMAVSKCYALFGEYNADYDVNTVTEFLLSRNQFANYWEKAMKFDMTDTWEYVYTSAEGTALAAPYIKLR
ncbi:MAG: Ig-like domain-containing protein [Candidatus Coproplasma sp.]